MSRPEVRGSASKRESKGAAFCKGLGCCIEQELRIPEPNLGPREPGVLSRGVVRGCCPQRWEGAGQASAGLGAATDYSAVLWPQTAKQGGSQTGPGCSGSSHFNNRCDPEPTPGHESQVQCIHNQEQPVAEDAHLFT